MGTYTNLVVNTFYTNAILTFFIIREIVFAASASSLSTVIVHTKDFRGRGSTVLKILVLYTAPNKVSIGIVSPTLYLRLIEEKNPEIRLH